MMTKLIGVCFNGIDYLCPGFFWESARGVGVSCDGTVNIFLGTAGVLTVNDWSNETKHIKNILIVSIINLLNNLKCDQN